MKICTKCTKSKPAVDFRKHRNSCKQCEYNTKVLHRQTPLGKAQRSIESSTRMINHREKVLASKSKSDKKYRQTERGKNVAHDSRVRRRSRLLGVWFTRHDRSEILDRDNWKCKSCNTTVHDRSTGKWNTPDKAHIDHIIPISKGGNSEPDNLQVLCRSCNLSKKDKLTG